MKIWTLAAVVIMNLGFLWLGPGEGVTKSDPVVVAFAFYGLCHVEWIMFRWTIAIHTATNRIRNAIP